MRLLQKQLQTYRFLLLLPDPLQVQVSLNLTKLSCDPVSGAASSSFQMIGNYWKPI